MDGKYPLIHDNGESNYGSNHYLQVYHAPHTGEATHGVIRIITVVLINAVGRPLLGAIPVVPLRKFHRIDFLTLYSLMAKQRLIYLY